MSIAHCIPRALVLPALAFTLSGCALFGGGSGDDDEIDMAKPSGESLAAAGSGWTSLGYLPLPGGIRGVDGRANLNIKDLARQPDGTVKALFYSITLSQQDPITRVDSGTLKDGTFTSDKLAQNFGAKGTTYGIVGNTFHFPAMRNAGVGLTQVSGTMATKEADVVDWMDRSKVGLNILFAGDPAATSYVTWCEAPNAQTAGGQLVMSRREGASGTWTEVARQADECVPAGSVPGFGVVQGAPRLVYANDETKQVVSLTPASATSFTRAAITIPTTSAILVEVADGKAHVGYADTGNAGKATVARIEGDQLVPVGKSGFTTLEALPAPRHSGGRVHAVVVNQSALALEVLVAD